MKLLWHFIRKDLSALRLWLAAWFAAVGIHFALRVYQLAHGNHALPEQFTNSHRPDYLVLLLLIALIVPQVVQLDPPARAGAFWKMLPLARWRVLLAKVALIGAVFIVVPAIFEVLYFTMAGFGTWTWVAVGAWFRSMAPLVLIVAGAGALARDLRVAALLISAAVLALLPGSANTFRALLEKHSFGFMGDLSQEPVLAMTWPAWQLAIVALVAVPWQYLARGRFGCLVAIAAFAVAWPLGRPAPAGVVPPVVEKIGKVEGVRVEVDPWNTYIRTTSMNAGVLSNIGVYFRVTGIPEGMEIEKITMPEGRLVRGKQIIEAAQEAELMQRGVYIVNDTESRARDWFQVDAPAGPDGLRVVSSPYFPMSYEAMNAEPTNLEGTVRVHLQWTRRIREAPLQPGDYWQSGLHRAGIVRAGYEREASLAIRQRIEFALVDLAGKSLNPPPAGPLRLRLHQVPLDRWIDLMMPQRTNTNLFELRNRAGDDRGESFEVQSRFDLTRSLDELFADYRLDFDRLSGANMLPPLVRARFREGIADLSAWRIEIESRERFISDVPIRIAGVVPQESMWRQSGKPGGPRAALGDALAALTLRDPGNAQAVDEYLRALFNLLGGRQGLDDMRRYDNTILLKLAAVGPDNLQALCRWGQRAGEPAVGVSRNYASGNNDWHRRAPAVDYRCAQFRRVVIDLTEPRHKDVILLNHTPQFDLLDAIRERAWVEEALPRMCARAEKEPVPESWIALFADRPGPVTDAAILAQSRLGAVSTLQLARTAARPGGGLQPAISACWRAATDSTANPVSLLHIFTLACKHGLPEMPGDLRVLIDAARPPWIREDEFESAKWTLLDVFALHSDCPTDPAFARPWLAEHAAALRFNPNTQRYELH